MSTFASSVFRLLFPPLLRPFSLSEGGEWGGSCGETYEGCTLPFPDGEGERGGMDWKTVES